MMPAGTYFVGDLTAVMHDDWNEICYYTISEEGKRLSGEFELGDGRQFALYTVPGQKAYFDQDGRKYVVQSDSIGCINLFNFNYGGDHRHAYEDGQIIEFKTPFVTLMVNGILTFGNVHIHLEDEESTEPQ